MVGDHDESPNGDAEQDRGNDVPQLEQPEVRQAEMQIVEVVRSDTGALVPAELLVGVVQPPRGEERHQPDGQEPQDQREDHGLGPRPLEVPDPRLEPIRVRLRPLLETRWNQPQRKLHPFGPSRGDAGGLYRRPSERLKHPGEGAGGDGVEPENDRAAGARRARYGGGLVKAFTSIASTMAPAQGVCNPIDPATDLEGPIPLS